MSFYAGLNTNPVIILANRELTIPEKADLDVFVNAYVDPAEFLTFNHTDTCTMNTMYSNDPSLSQSGDKKVMQTFIFTNQNSVDVVLDSIKTIVEYRCPDVTMFSQEPNNRQIVVDIYDVTRDYLIAELTIPLSEIASEWDQKAIDTPNSSASKWRTLMFTGLHTKTTNYDCIWQLRVSNQNPTFFVGLGSMQHIFYDVSR